MDSLPANHVIVIERVTFCALEKIYPEWLHGIVDMASSKSGHRIVVTSSYFMAFSKRSSHANCFKSIQSYFTHLSLLRASGNVAAQEVSRQQGILCSFLMSIDGLGRDRDSDNEEDDQADEEYYDDHTSATAGMRDGLRSARLRLMPKGYFAGPKVGIMVVSQNLKSGCSELLYIRNHVGRAMTDQLLAAHDFDTNGGLSPLEQDWKCVGPPVAPGIPAEECRILGKEEGPQSDASVVGGAGGGNSKNYRHPFHGLILCRHCRRKMPRRELATLEEWEVAGKLKDTTGLQERLEELRQRTVDHRGRDQVARDKRKRKIESNGILSPSKRARDLTNDRNRQGRNSTTFATDATAHQAHLQRQSEHDAKQKQNGKKKKKGVNRVLRAKKKPYPKPFMTMLTRAVQMFVQASGEENIYWNKIVPLFDELIIRENKIGGLLERFAVVFAANAKPKYLQHAKILAACLPPSGRSSADATSHSNQGLGCPRLRQGNSTSHNAQGCSD